MQEQLQPFIRAIASRHGDLEMLSPDDVSVYVDTVLAVIFYRHGYVRLALHGSGSSCPLSFAALIVFV